MDDLESRFPRTMRFLRQVADTSAISEDFWRLMDEAISDSIVKIATKRVPRQFGHDFRILRKDGPIEETQIKRARRLLKHAVQSGRLYKPDKCDRCKQFMLPQYLHGHHEDYFKPLDVQWLCPRCHGAQHGSGQNEVRRMKRNERHYLPEKTRAQRLARAMGLAD